MNDPVHTETFKTAEEFLRALDPTDPRWINVKNLPNQGNWWFRGQSDSSLPLIPKAFRPGVQLTSDDPIVHSPCNCNSEQVAAEQRAMMEFFDMCDAQALVIPDDSQNWRSAYHETLAPEFEQAALGTGNRWPMPQVLSVLALAQHHGVPTRLLDWSADALCAAYFAGRDAAAWARGIEPWPAHAQHLMVASFHRLAFQPVQDLRIQPITAAASHNRNLAAQRGRFKLVRRSFEPHDPVCRESFADTVRTVAKLDSYRWSNYPPTIMRRMLLPIGEAPRLMRLLRYKGISAASMLPGYDGVVKGIRERRLFDL